MLRAGRWTHHEAGMAVAETTQRAAAGAVCHYVQVLLAQWLQRRPAARLRPCQTHCQVANDTSSAHESFHSGSYTRLVIAAATTTFGANFCTAFAHHATRCHWNAMALRRWRVRGCD
jgi:hypothetical protein